MGRRRLGIVLLVPDGAAAEVQGLRRACGDKMLPRIAPHITLVPPINVREDDLGAALAIVREAAAGSGPLSLALGPPATFLPDNPVLYLGVGGPDGKGLSALRSAVTVGPLERPAEHDFVPHVTISIASTAQRIEAALTALSDFSVDVTIDRVHVLEERRDDDDQRVWRPIADALLCGRSVVGRGGLDLELTVSGSVEPAVKDWSVPLWERADQEDLGAADEQEALVVTARRDGEVVGLLEGWIWADLGYVTDLLVGESVRGEGIGRHLLARFEAEARRRDCTSLALRAVAGTHGEAVYRRLGWEAESRQRRWARGRDFVQFRRWL